MNKFTYRRGQILLTLLSLFVFACSLYLQYHENLQPCPLCLMQRLCVSLLFMLGFIGVYVQSLKRSKLLLSMQMFVAASGLFFVSRQLWLQSLPAGQTPACMPGLDVLIRYFPWQDVIQTLLWGSGDCAEISWKCLGISMPAWAGFYFLIILFSTVFFFWSLSRNPIKY